MLRQGHQVVTRTPDHQEFMDAVSAVASVAGLLALASTIVKTAYSVASSTKDFRKEWTSIANGVAQLLGVVAAIKLSSLDRISVSVGPIDSSSPEDTLSSTASTPIETDYDVVSPRRARAWIASQLVSEVSACEKTLTEIEQLLCRTKPNLKSQMMWPFQKSLFKKLLDRLEAHKSTLVLVLSTQGTMILQNEAEHAQVERAFFLEDIEDRKRTQVLDWLSSYDFRMKLRSLKQSYIQGTGLWILEAAGFQGWEASHSGNILWCQGEAGVGKTMLTTVIIKHLEEKQNSVAPYIYFDHQDRMTQNSTEVLASILKQLLLPLDLTRWPSSLFQRLEARKYNVDERDLLKCIIHTARQYQKVFIILDALDECDDGASRRKLLDFIHTVVKCEPKVKIVFTSRPQLSCSTQRIIVVRSNRKDIETYIRVRLRHKHYHPDLEDEIVSKIIVKSDGVFLLSKLHLDHVIEQFTPQSIRHALASLPSSVDSIYSQFSKRISRRGQQAENYVFKTLAWVVYGARALTVCELLEALSVEDWDTDVDPLNRPTREDVLESCLGLVTVQSDDTVHISHVTAKEYFPRCLQMPHAAYLAKVCLTYLLSNATESAHRGPDDSPFLRYAAQNWATHLTVCQDDKRVIEHFKRLVFDKQRWRNILAIDRADTAKEVRQITPLHVAAKAGLGSLTTLLLHWGADVCEPEQDEEGRTALHDASAASHVDMALQLVTWRPGLVNVTDRYGRLPLHYAAQSGSTQMVSMLLTNKSDPARKDARGWNPLYVALSWREDKAARLIFDAMFVNEISVTGTVEGFVGIGTEGHTILHQAAHMGYVGATRRLLKSGADPYAVTYSGLTPLVFAAREGHMTCVEILLDAMEEGMKRSTLLYTPLHIAAQRGQAETARVLLAADPSQADAKDFLQFTPIHWAAAGGHTEVVRVLLPVSSTGEHNPPNPFQLACWGGHKDVVDAFRTQDPTLPPSAKCDVKELLATLDQRGNEFPCPDDFDLTVFTGEIEISCYYGQVLLKKRKLELASAWLDFAIFRCPGNNTIRDPENLICAKKRCDHCNALPIIGPYYACLACLPQCYDLCSRCFQARDEIGHAHGEFLKVPTASFPLPTYDGHVERINRAMDIEMESGLNPRKAPYGEGMGRNFYQ